MEYKNRILDKLLEERLDAFGAVLISGPKACGSSDGSLTCGNNGNAKSE